jgi:prepilin-type N-terminal cleavage/methylation domain-containing protein
MRPPVAPARDGERGVTLVELMIAMLILGVVVASAFSVAFAIMNGYREHRRAIAVERSARGAMAVLAEAVRNASPGLSDGNIVDLVGCEDTWKGMLVENSSVAPDALNVIYVDGGVVSSLRLPFDQGSSELRIEDGSLLAAGDQVLVTDFAIGHLLAVQTVTEVTPTEWIVELAGAPTTLCAGVAAFAYQPRATVLRVQKARFFIDDAGGVPALWMDPDGPTGARVPEAVAEGIEDLQVAVGIDRDGDGRIGEDQAGSGDDDDWVYNHPSDTAPALMTVKPYRAVRLTVTARSLDDTSESPVSRRPAAEDRSEAVARDELRRRSLSTTVEIRNLEGSP